MAVGLLHWQFMPFGVFLFYSGFDLLGWKWIVHWTHTPDLWLAPPPSAKLAYRFLQHTVMIPILYLAWLQHPAAALIPFILWMTGAADIFYHWIMNPVKEIEQAFGLLDWPGWKNGAKYLWNKIPKEFNYLYWTGPLGWVYFINKGIIPRSVMVSQALLGVALSVWLFV